MILKSVRKFPLVRTSALAVMVMLFSGGALYGAALAQADDASVESEITAYAIMVDDNGVEQRLPADEISPGGIIEYELTYKNVSDAALASFVILGNVPDATHYYSADPLEDASAVFEVSVTDIGWATPPIIRYEDDGFGVLRPVEVPAEEFEALRWRLAEPMTPGEEVSATYRIKVED